MHLPLLFVLLMALIALSSACTRSVNPDIERGSSYVFQPGFPEILASSIGFLDEEDQGFIRVSAEIVKPSLIYRSLNDTSKARLLMEVRIVGVTDPSFSRTVQETIEVLYNPLQQQADEVDTYERTLDMDPGRYTVTISITDLNSNKVSSSSETTFIPNPEAPENNLATIRMEGLQVDQDGDQPTFLPINSYDVPSKVDSLLFLTQLTNQSSESPLWIQTRLLRFRSDASPARPMQFNNYGNSSLPYKGIEYDEYEIVRQTDRVLQQEGSVLLEIPVDPLSRGNYRFEVLIYEGEQEPTEDEESRIIEHLRMGKSPILAKTRNDIGIDDNPTCPHCHEEEETAEHLLLTCPRWTAARLDLFGPYTEPRDVFKDPRTLVTFLKRIGAMPSI